MPEELNQDVQQGNPDETAAVLSFATKLQEGMLPKAPQTQEIEATSVPEEKGQEVPEEEKEASEVDLGEEMGEMMDSKLDELRKEMKETIKEEMSSIKESIEEALKEE